MRKFMSAKCYEDAFLNVVAHLRRRPIYHLNKLEQHKRFLSPMWQAAVETVQNERRHRMGGN